jgi:hypothetical protein
MISNNRKIVLLILIIGLLAAIALPKFSLNLGDKMFNFSGIDSIIKKYNAQVGDFKRGYGIYPSKKIDVSLSFDDSITSADQKNEILKTTLSSIKTRINFANLYDVRVEGVVTAEQYKLVFEYPEYFINPEKYTQWLIYKGEIAFTNANQESPRAIELNDYQIEGGIVVDYLAAVGNHLAFRFEDGTENTIEQGLIEGTSGRYFLMTIDGNPLFFVIDYDEFTDTNKTSVRALPTQAVEFANPQERTNFLNIVRSYFVEEKSLDATLTLAPDTLRPESSKYSLESGYFIAVSFIVGSVLVLLSVFLRYRFKGLLVFGSFLAYYAFLLTVILKLLSANISISLILGFLVSYGLACYLGFDLLRNTQEKPSLISKNLKEISLLMLICFVAIFKLSPSLGEFTDVVGVFISSALVLFIISQFGIKELTMYYQNKILQTN